MNTKMDRNPFLGRKRPRRKRVPIRVLRGWLTVKWSLMNRIAISGGALAVVAVGWFVVAGWTLSWLAHASDGINDDNASDE